MGGLNMARKHLMMLSDLYGRIGQALREHGDAPIGRVVTPIFPDEPVHPLECVHPVYVDVTQVSTEVKSGVNIKTYEVTIEE
jgi:hypothetical protein